MKRLTAVFLSIVFILSLVGCTKTTYKLPHDQFCYLLDGSQSVEIRTEDRQYIIDLLNDASWVDSLTNCACDFIFYTQAQEVRYHAECGTFNDCTNQRSTTVTEEQRAAINQILGID